MSFMFISLLLLMNSVVSLVKLLRSQISLMLFLLRFRVRRLSLKPKLELFRVVRKLMVESVLRVDLSDFIIRSL